MRPRPGTDGRHLSDFLTLGEIDMLYKRKENEMAKKATYFDEIQRFKRATAGRIQHLNKTKLPNGSTLEKIAGWVRKLLLLMQTEKKLEALQKEYGPRPKGDSTKDLPMD